MYDAEKKKSPGNMGIRQGADRSLPGAYVCSATPAPALQAEEGMWRALQSWCQGVGTRVTFMEMTLTLNKDVENF